MPRGSPGAPEVRANTRSCVARCIPELKRLAPSITHSSPVAARDRLEIGRVGAVVGLGETEGEPDLPAQGGRQQRLLLRRGAELVQEDRGRKVADQRRLALRVVVQPDAEPVEVLAHDRERVVGPASALRAPREARIATGPRDRRARPCARADPPSPRWGCRRPAKSVRACSRRWSKKRALSASASSGRTSLAMNASTSSISATTSSGRSSFICSSFADGSVFVR